MKLLMCAPAYYGIEYEINPWMRRSQSSDRAQAQTQWDGLEQLLRQQMAVEIELIDAQPGLPDMVFTANGGLAWKEKFIVSNFRYDVRRGEAAHFEQWFRQRGFAITHLPAEFNFEGEGDLLRCGDAWFAGYHIRSDIAAHHKVAAIIEEEILSLELTSDWFYHLDTCFCPLASGKALYYPPAFDRYALAVLQDNIPELIAVSDDEAKKFACNAIVTENSIAMNTGCPQVSERLASLGFTVYETPLGEFLKAGGSAKCLALMIG